jgi:hypothetical protein
MPRRYTCYLSEESTSLRKLVLGIYIKKGKTEQKYCPDKEEGEILQNFPMQSEFSSCHTECSPSQCPPPTLEPSSTPGGVVLLGELVV